MQLLCRPDVEANGACVHTVPVCLGAGLENEKLHAGVKREHNHNRCVSIQRDIVQPCSIECYWTCFFKNRMFKFYSNSMKTWTANWQSEHVQAFLSHVWQSNVCMMTETCMPAFNISVTLHYCDGSKPHMVHCTSLCEHVQVGFHHKARMLFLQQIKLDAVKM